MSTSGGSSGSSAKEDAGAVKFRAYGDDVIRQKIIRMLSYTRAVRRGNDPDALHDMRVASRRLRAALSVFADAYDTPEYARLQKAIRKVTATLSRARDLDVMIGGLQRDADKLPASQRSIISDVIRQWTAERGSVQGEVVEVLDRLTALDPLSVFDAIVRSATSETEEGAAGEP
jgi:CHAD domain-containing protein